MATAALTPGFEALARTLEAACSMGHAEIRGHLDKAMPGGGFIHDVNGNDKSGKVIYSGTDGTKRADYKISTDDKGNTKATIDHAGAEKVTPRVVYDSTEPKEAWKPEGIELREAATFCDSGLLQEAETTTHLAKIISAGRGSSGFYETKMLQRAVDDGVFKAGTHMYWNHDTDSQEAERPEGDLSRLAGVTSADATWQENGKDGPGIYAPVKVFSDYAKAVKEKGPHIGLSIRAGGDRDETAVAPDGKPRVITRLRNAASVDFVTKAGRGGKIFTEAARSHEGEDMDKNEVQALIREAVAPLQAENASLRGMLTTVKGKALVEAELVGIMLDDAIKTKIVEGIAPAIPLDASGNVDTAKLKTMVEAKCREWAELLPQLGIKSTVAAFGTRVTEASVLANAEAMDKDREQVMEGLANFFVGPKLGKSTDETLREARKESRIAFIDGRAA